MITAALVAFALASQSPQPNDGVEEPRRARAWEITPTDIDGKLEQPSIKRIYARPKGHRRNLIELRANFRPEMTKSVDALSPQ